MENLNLFYQDIGTSSSTGRHLTQEEAAKEALAIRISQKFALLEEVRPVLETMAYHDKYKKVLDEIWKDKVELDIMIVKEGEEAIKKVKGEALKEKDNPEAFIFPISMELGREEMKKVDRGITMINHTQAEAMGILTNVLYRTMVGNDAEAGSSRSKHSRQYETVEEVLLLQVHHDFLLYEGCNNEAKSRIKLREAESNEETITYVAWIRAFNIKEPIYAELCHEFYSTYEFDEVCADDELQTKKIIKFRLGGRAHNLTLLEFARRLGLYHADELEKDGFDVYFQGGLHSDDHFNAQEYWLSISREENLGLSRSHASTIRNPILRVVHKMITYGLCQRTTRKARVLTDVVLRSLSDPIYCRDLDTTTLRGLIDSEGRLILEDP
ncbi:hypothetical protein Tco_0761687 [Tanacetum coccineum]